MESCVTHKISRSLSICHNKKTSSEMKRLFQAASPPQATYNTNKTSGFAKFSCHEQTHTERTNPEPLRFLFMYFGHPLLASFRQPSVVPMCKRYRHVAHCCGDRLAHFTPDPSSSKAFHQHDPVEESSPETMAATKKSERDALRAAEEQMVRGVQICTECVVLHLPLRSQDS